MGIGGAKIETWACGVDRSELTCKATDGGVTDANGDFDVEPIGANPMAVRASAPGYRSAFWGAPDARTPEDAAVLRVDHDMTGLEIELPRK